MSRVKKSCGQKEVGGTELEKWKGKKRTSEARRRGENQISPLIYTDEHWSGKGLSAKGRRERKGDGWSEESFSPRRHGDAEKYKKLTADLVDERGWKAKDFNRRERKELRRKRRLEQVKAKV